eukprot:TRINITY_DN26045_c0_g1_i1.p1 TRINITY_DN26045_c0_g1~~TRINITY_DN26045_c0_g1_i1.p1  ORF type:complete len:207 (+),score=87.44 TRINITY_DN26045_c0_g1_i1:63-623(+)
MKLLALLVAVVAQATVAAELKIPVMPRKVATLERSSLSRFLKDLGYDITERENGSVYIGVKDEDGGEKVMDMAWSDHDTLIVRSAWNSPHTDLGDFSILNTWNQKYRFCKVSTQEATDKSQGNTVVVMHMDQFMPVGSGEEAVKAVLKKAVDIYKLSLVAFDKFLVDVYKQAIEKEKAKKENGDEA